MKPKEVFVVQYNAGVLCVCETLEKARSTVRMIKDMYKGVEIKKVRLL